MEVHLPALPIKIGIGTFGRSMARPPLVSLRPHLFMNRSRSAVVHVLVVIVSHHRQFHLRFEIIPQVSHVTERPYEMLLKLRQILDLRSRKRSLEMDCTFHLENIFA
jgi:hypothetical protein